MKSISGSIDGKIHLQDLKSARRKKLDRFKGRETGDGIESKSIVPQEVTEENLDKSAPPSKFPVLGHASVESFAEGKSPKILVTKSPETVDDRETSPLQKFYPTQGRLQKFTLRKLEENDRRYNMLDKRDNMHNFMQNISNDNPFYDNHSSCKKLHNELDVFLRNNHSIQRKRKLGDQEFLKRLKNKYSMLLP